MFNEDGFKIRKWASNNSEILQNLANTSKGQLLDKVGSAKTLGINWNPSKDLFQYRILSEISKPNMHTKRSILSQISQIFDPLGLLGPIIITAKLMIQQLWKMQLDWDESLSTNLQAK